MEHRRFFQLIGDDSRSRYRAVERARLNRATDTLNAAS